MSDEQAKQAVLDLIEWAKKRWGVSTEKKYQCPLSDGGHVYRADYPGYCPEDGRKLQEGRFETQSQKWSYNLHDFIDMPDYPVEEATS
jgi:hypothetical protein